MIFLDDVATDAERALLRALDQFLGLVILGLGVVFFCVGLVHHVSQTDTNFHLIGGAIIVIFGGFYFWDHRNKRR